MTNLEPRLDFGQLAEEDYEFIRRLVYETSRIHLGPDKKVLVATRLAKRLRQLGLADYSDYCDLLRSPAGQDELAALINRISTNHTQFFREMRHFDFLRQDVIPAWLARQEASHTQFRVWSAACSSGEEPYSLAIYLSEYLAPPARRQWHLDATDISTRVLEIAQQAVYEDSRLASVSAEWLRRYFQKGVANWQGHFRVKEELRRQIDFHSLNLLQPDYPFAQPFQLILCRNVMIYFDRATQEELVRRLAQRLVPGGYLMVGHAESLSGIRHELRLVQPAIYLKP